MKEITSLDTNHLDTLFFDIDDTITTDGLLPAESYSALWSLHSENYNLIPITGRPAGWCEMIARFWPVNGVIGENGAFYFKYDRKNKRMNRYFILSEEEMMESREKLDLIESEVLKKVPGAQPASDQFCRLIDLAIDFCEDVAPLEKPEVLKIVEIFKKHGATAKVSSIHVNGWFGDFNKLSMCEIFLAKELSINWNDRNKKCLFIGDSPNDEPMFAAFENSVGVANIKNFVEDLKTPPNYITKGQSAAGFKELADHILNS